MSDYTIITDPGHSWLKVSANELLEAIKAGCNFTSCSYYDPADKTAYLEEDIDAGAFLKWLRNNGREFRLDYQDYDRDCFVRDLISLNYQGQPA